VVGGNIGTGDRDVLQYFNSQNAGVGKDVTTKEVIEQLKDVPIDLFFDEKAVIFSDTRHSTAREKRWILYSRSIYHNVLMVAFTVRVGKIRIISARKASRRERETYEENKS
jgi:uncharacterized DUF497 family protein